MTPKPSPAVDPLTPEAPSLTESMPTPAAPAALPIRCIQRPTGEWFTFATTNAPGKDTPDASDLCTETEVREKLADLGHGAAAISAFVTQARASAEVSGDIADWNAPTPNPS